jgi:hypothetical protein
MEGETITGCEGRVETEDGKIIGGRTEARVGDRDSVDEGTATEGKLFS